MSQLKTKSIHSPIEVRKDGLRILAARFRGRGMTADRYDVWMANLGPSEVLLRSFLDGAIGWREFRKDYLAELFLPSPVDQKNRTIKNHGQKFPLRLVKELARDAVVPLRRG